MQQFFKQVRVMEAETIQKNGASPKSLTSRGNCKIVAIFVFALSFFGFTGCEKDDENSNFKANDLVGTLELVKIEGYMTINGQKGEEWTRTAKGQSGNGEGMGFDFCVGDRITFNANGTGQSGREPFNWRLKGNRLIFNWDDDDEKIELPVKSLTAEQTVFYYEESGKEYGVSYTFHEEYTYTKIK